MREWLIVYSDGALMIDTIKGTVMLSFNLLFPEKVKKLTDYPI
ncbi:MAG: hypothetical protein N4435_04875 [Candidatus Ornithobacterium hominis]|nr:hypothetical protein [Candidatus Ornithobacterium hominis]MCT7904523.1 hypothetical protein [Candidatus Ornithobacterium hominis]